MPCPAPPELPSYRGYRYPSEIISHAVWLHYLSGGKTPRGRKIGDPEGVLELLWLLFTTVLVWARPRQDLVLENLLLRHQLAVLTRPTRTRPRARLRAWDKLL